MRSRACPLISAVGCAVDYSIATRIKAKLQSAADAASVASISRKSAGYVAATLMSTRRLDPRRRDRRHNIFNGNIATITGYAILGAGVTATVTKTGIRLTSTVSFTAQVPVTFMKVDRIHHADGDRQFDIERLAAALSGFLSGAGRFGLDGPAVDDVRSRADAVRSTRITISQYPTGCTLACHFSPQNSACTDGGTQGYPTNSYCMGYAISRVSQSGFANLLIKQNPQGKYP